jgi:hypothetical protein
VKLHTETHQNTCIFEKSLKDLIIVDGRGRSYCALQSATHLKLPSRTRPVGAKISSNKFWDGPDGPILSEIGCSTY